MCIYALFYYSLHLINFDSKSAVKKNGISTYYYTFLNYNIFSFPSFLG